MEGGIRAGALLIFGPLFSEEPQRRSDFSVDHIQTLRKDPVDNGRREERTRYIEKAEPLQAWLPQRSHQAMASGTRKVIDAGNRRGSGLAYRRRMASVSCP